MPDDHEHEMVVDADVVSVLIVDDQAPFRLAARAVLRRAEGFELVGEAADGGEAVERVRELRPALVLMDINMPTMNGIEATRQIIAEVPDTTVFLCSTYQRSDLPPEAESSASRRTCTRRSWPRPAPPAVGRAPPGLSATPPGALGGALGGGPPSRDGRRDQGDEHGAHHRHQQQCPPVVGVREHEGARRGQPPQRGSERQADAAVRPAHRC